MFLLIVFGFYINLDLFVVVVGLGINYDVVDIGMNLFDLVVEIGINLNQLVLVVEIGMKLFVLVENGMYLNLLLVVVEKFRIGRIFKEGFIDKLFETLYPFHNLTLHMFPEVPSRTF